MVNKRGIFLAAFLVLFLFVDQVQAYDCSLALVPCGGEGQEPCTFCNFFELIANIINYVTLCLVPPVAGLMLIIGGGMFYFGGMNPGLINQAKSLLKSVVIGLVLIYGSFMIVHTILSILGVNISGLGNILEGIEISCVVVADK